MTQVLLAAILALTAVYLLYRAQGQRKLGGLPHGELVYSDTIEEPCPVLVSHRYGLKGKPDALVRTRTGQLIPVERKNGRAPRRPYDGDLVQGTAYCVLVEEEYG